MYNNNNMNNTKFGKILKDLGYDLFMHAKGGYKGKYFKYCVTPKKQGTTSYFAKLSEIQIYINQVKFIKSCYV